MGCASAFRPMSPRGCASPNGGRSSRSPTEFPSRACIDANAHALARYATLCQEGGLVPIVEPEVLMDGDHGLAACLAATEATLDAVFAQLRVQGVLLEGMLLKPNMVVSGLACLVQARWAKSPRRR